MICTRTSKSFRLALEKKKELIKSTFQADFRVGWNSLLLGFSGLWHYVNIIDFQYAYKIYTPIKDFEDNGVVAKLIYKEGLDFETSFKLSRYKVNISIHFLFR